ncbi:MAG: MFS transporter [Actinobacteria bacterium HGW-Actinobacteria-2]|nr:MAG: MFS transporter [Actinobacteria bacterium HGW-Actinobacteria-2]
MSSDVRPNRALWSLVIGFFMILMDTTIVTVANPRIMQALDADINQVMWATSAYLLTYAVPLLVTGRLGDRFGPKRIYLLGLVVFTASSAWAGLVGSVEMLIVARAVQGLGAALLTPQTMAVITRIFPPQSRGRAMSVWGAAAAVATLVGPILGGFIVDAWGWEWIFFVNVPIGIIGIVAAWRFVPTLETHSHHFDLPGVALWGVGMFAVVFALQEGESYNWGTIAGPVTVIGLLVFGLVVLAIFLGWQKLGRGEPLLPLRLFGDRNFALANGAISLVGVAITASALPMMFYYQLVLGFSPTRAALQTIPTAVLSGVLAPVVGRLVDRVHPRILATSGLVVMAGSLGLYAAWMVPDETLWWRLLIPAGLMGIGASFTYSPIGTTATYNLAGPDAGAGSGIYNSMRQVGAVVGSAAIAALMQAQLAVHLPGGSSAASAAETSGRLPAGLQSGFSTAMAISLLLPAAAALVAAVITIFFAARSERLPWRPPTAPAGQASTDAVH